MHVRALGWLLVMLLAGACDPSDEERDDGMTEDAGGDEASDDDVGCSEILCWADFPCTNNSYCASDTQLRPCRTIPCEEYCGTPCCSGASCDEDLPAVECTGDTVCWELHEPGYYTLRTAECRPRPTEPPPVDGGGDVGEDDGGADGGPYDVWLPPGAYERARGCMM